MKPELEILDYSVYGNAIDAESDRLLAAAAENEGFRTTVRAIALDQEVRPAAERVWLRYDLRSPGELHWIVGLSERLHAAGHRVFPSALSLVLAGDKWETYQRLRAVAVPTPPTRLSNDPERPGYPLMLKRRVSWGGIGNRVLRGASDIAATTFSEEDICQPFIPHQRTWIVPVAGGVELFAIEARRDPGHDGDVRLLSLPEGGAGLASAALKALELAAGTADLMESEQGLLVLEVNSAPRLPYPDLPGADLATPMVRAVLKWMED